MKFKKSMFGFGANRCIKPPGSKPKPQPAIIGVLIPAAVIVVTKGDKHE